MKALVTGAGGFIGKHLVRLLDRGGWSGVALIRRLEAPSGLTSTNFRLIEGDIMDEGALRDLVKGEPFDVVFHLAGVGALAGRVETYRTNVVGTAHLLEALRTAQLGCRVILMGSSAEYGSSQDDPLTEQAALLPLTHYGVSKLCVSRMGRAAFEETGQDIVCIRPFNIVGPGQRGHYLQPSVIAQIVAAERSENPIVVRTGGLDAFRDFIDVRDVVSGLIAAVQSGEAGEVYNLCSGTGRSARSLVEQIIAFSDLTVELHVDEAKSLGVNVPYQRGSAEKLRRRSGWEALIPFDQSLRDAFAAQRADMAVEPGW
jgi:GDP-4-dehydro-6-deoxy-D-mannose reductase